MNEGEAVIHRGSIDVIGRRPGMERVGPTGAGMGDTSADRIGRRPGMDRVEPPADDMTKAAVKADAARGVDELAVPSAHGAMRSV